MTTAPLGDTMKRMHLNWRLIGIHAVIIFALTVVGGFLVGFVGGFFGSGMPIYALAISNLISASAGFAYSAYKVSEKRWAHLGAVALVLWLMSLINPLLGLATFGEWVLSLIAIIFFMVIGGGVGALIAKRA